MNSLKNYLRSLILDSVTNCCKIPEGPMSYLPFHIVLFSAFMFLVSIYGYSVLQNVNILCIGQVNFGLFFGGISLLASIVVTTISAIWGFRIKSKKCQRAFFLIVLILNIVAFASIMTTTIIWNDSGMMVKNDNGAVYKCNITTFMDHGSTEYKTSIRAYQVLLDYNVTKVIGANSKCVFQQIDDICGTYGSFRHSTELRDKQEDLGAYICSNSDEIGVSLCRLHLSTLSSYMSLAIGIGFLLNLSLVFSNLYFFIASCRNTDFGE